jgi:hypothetical protein
VSRKSCLLYRIKKCKGEAQQKDFWKGQLISYLRRKVGGGRTLGPADLCSDGDDKPRTTGAKPGTLSAPQIVLPNSFLGPLELDLFTDSIIDRKSKKHGSRKKVIAGEKK